MANNDYKSKLIEYLFQFIEDNRKQRFNSVINERTRYLAIIMEDIYQSHNTSAVIRSCDCFGIQDIHIIENRNEFCVNKDIDIGSSKWINTFKYKSKENNTLDAIDSLKSKGYKIVATTPHKNGYTIDELPINEKIALLFGTELSGLSNIALENADYYVYIPMVGFTESLNISVSAAVLINQLMNRIKQTGINWQLSENEKNDITLQWLKKTIKRYNSIEKHFNNNIFSKPQINP